MKRSRVLMLAGLAGLYLALRNKKKKWDNFFRRVVLIFGGSRGLGLELARQLLDDGAFVAICARDAQELAYAREAAGFYSGNLATFQGDVTSAADIQRVIDAVVDQFGRIDVLINNAGLMQVGPLQTMNIAEFDRAMNTNFWGAVHACLKALPILQRQNEGRIVNIASIGGVVNPPHLVPYNASKAALIGFSESLSAEVSGDICVTTVFPGLMRTGSPLNAEFKGNADAEFLWFGTTDMLPGFSIRVQSAARKILNACRRGDRELTFTVPAKIGAVMHALFPNTTVNLFGIVNRLLPKSTRPWSKRGSETQGIANQVLKRQLEVVGTQQNQSSGLA